jgi:hypothetical protein
MKAFTVHMPSDLSDDEAPERAAFVKDGFCWPALFIPVLWLLWCRLWLVLLGYLIAVMVIGAVQIIAGEGAATLILIAFAFYFAAEANNARRWSLNRRGWTPAGEAFGRDRDEAEIRYFSDRSRNDGGDRGDRGNPPVPAKATLSPAAAGASVAGLSVDPDAADIVGLFPQKD